MCLKGQHGGRELPVIEYIEHIHYETFKIFSCNWILEKFSIWYRKARKIGDSDGKVSVCNAGVPGSIPGLGRYPGEGNGNSPQYSCLENSMDGGAWWATLHGVAKSRTWLRNFTLFLSFFSLKSYQKAILLALKEDSKQMQWWFGWQIQGIFSSLIGYILAGLFFKHPSVESLKKKDKIFSFHFDIVTFYLYSNWPHINETEMR